MTPWLFTLGVLSGIFALFTAFIRRRWYLSEALIGFLFGVLIGPVGLGWLTLDWSGADRPTLELAARIILALAIMEIALRLPQGYPFRHWRSLTTILAGVMPLMALISGLLVVWLVDLPLWVAMLVGAVTIPTDPIIASAILTGRLAQSSLPARTRHVLAGEVGANDGTAYPIILLFILLVTQPPGAALTEWLSRVLLWETAGGAVAGGVLGYAAAHLRHWAARRETIEPEAFAFFPAALTFMLLALSDWLRLDGFLGIFAAGVVYRLRCGDVGREHDIQQSLSYFLMFPGFALVGAVVPWSAWVDLGWRAVALALAVTLLRRLPAVLLMQGWIPALKERRDTLFVGWFGPIGIDTFYFALLAVGRTQRVEVWEIGSLLLTASLFAHGWTATPLTRRYRAADTD